MLTANIWQQVGLCNGAAGVVYKLNIPRRTVTTKLANCRTCRILTLHWPTIFTRQPQVYTNYFWMGVQQLHYAITIHKSQRQTLHKTRHWKVWNVLRMYICCFIKIEEIKWWNNSTYELWTSPKYCKSNRKKAKVTTIVWPYHQFCVLMYVQFNYIWCVNLLNQHVKSGFIAIAHVQKQPQLHVVEIVKKKEIMAGKKKNKLLTSFKVSLKSNTQVLEQSYTAWSVEYWKTRIRQQLLWW